MDYVKVRNKVTGKTGKVPERVFLKSDVLEAYDGPLDPECGCNGFSLPAQDVPEIEGIEHDITLNEEEE